MSEALLCYLYLYLVMGALFFLGMAYLYKQGDVGFSSPQAKRNTAMLLGGYVLYAALHGFFQFVASGW